MHVMAPLIDGRYCAHEIQMMQPGFDIAPPSIWQHPPPLATDDYEDVLSHTLMSAF
uniref:Uncharacterized protein n=1 Tax=Medicago truncatula TaxID=3880 RepID=A2Q2V8_MEDTR|nr:hypothetical protein MtrDRAFT_AC152185g41v2 [Medicago truncatula]